MSDSDDSMDENVEEPAVKVDPNTEDVKIEEFDRKTLPKHLKQRYWNSWEEMHLIELWRQHFHQVTDLEHNLPIFCTIGAGLREYGYNMNAQEIRRKMKTIKNKYIQETRYHREHGGKSQWRLYRLMHCMMSPRRPNCDLNYKDKTLKAVMENNTNEKLFHIFASGLPVNETLKRIENGENVEIPQPKAHEICFPIENKKIAARILCAAENKHKLTFTPRVFRHNVEVAERHRQFINMLKTLSTNILIKPSGGIFEPSPPPVPTPQIATSTSNQQQQQYKLKTKSLHGQGILKTIVNQTALENIRAENRKLMEDLVLATKKLKQEEQQLKSYEAMMNEVKDFYEKIFERLEIANANI